MIANRPNVLIYPDAESASREAAERFCCAVISGVANYGESSVALSGGTAPRRLFEMLAGDDFASLVPWSKTHVFFADERCVPHDDPASNYRQAHDLLLCRVPIPSEMVHPFRTDLPPADAATAYESEIRCVLGGFPRFDLIILGMGADGHTASLFPGSPALREAERLAVDTLAPGPVTQRLTLTLSAINAARRVMFLAFGEEKAQTLCRVLGSPEPTEALPASLVAPQSGPALWLIDEPAASNLTE